MSTRNSGNCPVWYTESFRRVRPTPTTPSAMAKMLKWPKATNRTLHPHPPRRARPQARARLFPSSPGSQRQSTTPYAFAIAPVVIGVKTDVYYRVGYNTCVARGETAGYTWELVYDIRQAFGDRCGGGESVRFELILSYLYRFSIGRKGCKITSLPGAWTDGS